MDVFLVTKLMHDMHNEWAYHATFSQYAFNVMARGALDALPSPVSRRNQKTVKSEWFDVQRRTGAATEEVSSLRSWLMAQSIRANDGGSVGARWTSHHIATELGKVISLGLPFPGHRKRHLRKVVTDDGTLMLGSCLEPRPFNAALEIAERTPTQPSILSVDSDPWDDDGEDQREIPVHWNSGPVDLEVEDDGLIDDPIEDLM